MANLQHTAGLVISAIMSGKTVTLKSSGSQDTFRAVRLISRANELAAERGLCFSILCRCSTVEENRRTVHVFCLEQGPLPDGAPESVCLEDEIASLAIGDDSQV